MDAEDIRRFARRAWSEPERLTVEHVAETFRRAGSKATLAMAHQLFEHARRIRPGFPGAWILDRDLANHCALAAKLERARDAVAVR